MSQRVVGVRFSILSALVVLSVLLSLSWNSTFTTLGNSASRPMARSTVKPKNGTIQQDAHQRHQQVLNDTQTHNNSSSSPFPPTLSKDTSKSRARRQHNGGHLYQHTFSSNQTMTILVQLSGELGNNLGKIAHGICLQEWLQEEFDTISTIVLRHQRHDKWIRGYQNAIKCFPYTRQFDFAAGNTPSMDAWLAGPNHPDWWETMQLVNGNGADSATIRRALKSTVNQWRQNLANASSFLNNVTTANGTPVSQPFLYANQFAHLHVCMDRYYDVIRARLAFDTSECCQQVPFANETVFVSVLEKRVARITEYPLVGTFPYSFLVPSSGSFRSDANPNRSL